LVQFPDHIHRVILFSYFRTSVHLPQLYPFSLSA
jgi:hypothetical protein